MAKIGLAEVDRVPRLVRADAQHAVPDVAVLAVDVGEGVVQVVVRVAPLVGGAGGVPLEGAGGQRRVTGPVVLAVHDVVADLHVVEDLADAEGAAPPIQNGGQEAEEQRGPPGGGQAALPADDPAQVGDVVLAEVGDDPLADGVELATEGVEVGLGLRP